MRLFRKNKERARRMLFQQATTRVRSLAMCGMDLEAVVRQAAAQKGFVSQEGESVVALFARSVGVTEEELGRMLLFLTQGHHVNDAIKAATGRVENNPELDLQTCSTWAVLLELGHEPTGWTGAQHATGLHLLDDEAKQARTA